MDGINDKKRLVMLKKKHFLVGLLLVVTGILPVSAQQKIARQLIGYIEAAPFKMQAPALPRIPDHQVSITDFGAVGDGHTLNTTAITRAINSCAAAGGGTVLVPPGLWLTGPLALKSNINLHVQQGAILLFSTDHSLYPIMKTKPSSRSYFAMSPVYGYELHDVAITGKGILDGAGDSWRPVKKDKMTDAQWKKLLDSGGAVSADGKMWWPSKEAMSGKAYLKKLKKSGQELTAKDFLPARDYLRPYMISLISCKRLLIDGPTFMNSPKFALYPKYCQDLVIRDVKINNEWWAQNGDGIDIANCRNVVIYNCTVNAGDDGICMKSSRTASDKSDSASLKNVVIADCIVYHAHGGFVIGSNTDGGMENILVRNCNFVNTDVGIRVKSRRGSGGLVHQVYIRNIYMAHIAREAILFDSYYELKTKSKAAFPVNATTPRFQDFYMDSIYCDGAGAAISLTGLPEMPVSRLFFSNMNITAAKGCTAADTAEISFKHVILNDHALHR
jgi:DNA sulfur modification protein DndE